MARYTLRELRLSKGLSRAEVSEQTGLSVSLIGYYETFKRNPNVENALNLAKFYGVKVEDIIFLHNVL